MTAPLNHPCRLCCALAAAGRIASGAGEVDGSNSDNGDNGNAHGAGLEARLEALQEALATKVAELARVSSERTALQLRCDKQEKAAREQELYVTGATCLLLRFACQSSWHLLRKIRNALMQSSSTSARGAGLLTR